MSGMPDPIRDVRGVGIDQYKAGLGEYLDAAASDAWAGGPLMQSVRLVQAGIADEDARDRGETLMTAEEASGEGRELGLRFEAPIARGAFDVIAGEKRRELAAEATFKRARLEGGYGTLHWLLGGGAEFLGQLVDPLNIASAFVPIVGQARYAAMAARYGRFPAALLKGAAEGAGGQALLEPLNIAEHRQQGEEFSLLGTLSDLAFGGGLGVALHGAAYGAGAGFRFVRDRYVVRGLEHEVAGRIADEARLAERERRAADAPLAERSLEVERVETPPERQPVAERMEELRPETKDAAMRTAIAQLAQDKPVDIAPVLRADPGWPAIEAAIEAGHHEVPELQRQATGPAELVATRPPEGWQPTPEVAKIATRAARGWEPEPPLAPPQSLVDFVRKNGGLIQGTPEAAELLASDVGRQPGLLRTREQGRQADHMAQAVADAGFRLGGETAAGSGVNVDAFVKALIEDASGRAKHYPDDAHTTAWRAQQEYFREFRRYLEDVGIEAKGMDARRLAWLLSQDPHTARLMVLVDAVDRLGPEGSLELAARLDAERAALEREILSEEPGAVEPDAPAADHREVPAATLAELERYYADQERAAVADQEGGRPAGGRPAAGRPGEGVEAPAARPGGRDDPAAPAGLRREGAQGPEGTERAAGDVAAGDAGGGDVGRGAPTADELARFAERQQQADLHADPAALAGRDERLAGEARETAQLLADDLRDHGHLIDEPTRGLMDDVGRIFDDEAKAINALAACKIGGGR